VGSGAAPVWRGEPPGRAPAQGTARRAPTTQDRRRARKGGLHIRPAFSLQNYDGYPSEGTIAALYTQDF